MEFADPNRVGFYPAQSLPVFGLVLPGLGSRLNASGFVYLANMSREIASGGVSSVFQDRPAAFFHRGTLTNVTGDRTPVIVTTFVSGDFALGEEERRRFYRLQVRSEVSGQPTRREIWPAYDFEIAREV